MRLTERDKQIILAVYRRRFLNTHQIEAVFFAPKSDGRRTRRTWAQHRLHKLFHHRYLARPRLLFEEGAGKPAKVYAICREGTAVVATMLGIDAGQVERRPEDDRVAIAHILHTVGINNLWTMVACLDRDGVLSLVDWVDDWQLAGADYRPKLPVYTKGNARTRKRPDGYFVVEHRAMPQPAHFFLEYDRGHMENARFAEKVKAYEAYRMSGDSQAHFGTRNFRVLTVTGSRKRLENLKRTTEAAGGDKHYWFTTQDQIDIWQPQRLLDPVWQAATTSERYALFG
jgi:hypothetical protein